MKHGTGNMILWECFTAAGPQILMKVERLQQNINENMTEKSLSVSCNGKVSPNLNPSCKLHFTDSPLVQSLTSSTHVQSCQESKPNVSLLIIHLKRVSNDQGCQLCYFEFVKICFHFDIKIIFVDQFQDHLSYNHCDSIL